MNNKDKKNNITEKINYKINFHEHCSNVVKKMFKLSTHALF